MATTYQHPIKCRDCGLHFLVLSWSQTWPAPEDEDEDAFPKIHCPECGGDRHIVWAPLELETEIFNVVPGAAALVEMT